MSSNTPDRLLARLRRDFDLSFAEPVELESEGHEDVLAIRAGDHQLALRVGETAVILRCPRLVALPSRQEALVGVVGVRGTLVAVYDIAWLVDGRKGSIEGGWIAVCAADPSAALRFDELVGSERVPARKIHAPDEGGGADAPADEVVYLGGIYRTVLSVRELLEGVARTAKISAFEDAAAGDDAPRVLENGDKTD